MTHSEAESVAIPFGIDEYDGFKMGLGAPAIAFSAPGS
jgi:hypothetical protein